MESSSEHNTTTESYITNDGPPYLTHPVLEFLLLFFQVANPLLSVLALLSTVVNIAVFSKMDIRDGLTQNFLILSVSDGLYAAILVAMTVCLMLRLYGGFSAASLATVRAATLFLFRLSAFPYYVSLVTTTVIAIVRCVSVVRPFQVRTILSPRVQLMLIATASTPSLVFSAYVMAQIRARWSVDPVTNASVRIYTIPLFDPSSRLSHANDTFYNVVFNTCLAIVVVSMAFLVAALKRSSKFRILASSKTPGESQSTKSSKAAARKEAVVVKSIILILAIFILGNLPGICHAVTRSVYPALSYYGRLHKLEVFMNRISGACLPLNLGLNSFVYYRFNSKYREVLKSVVRKPSIRT